MFKEIWYTKLFIESIGEFDCIFHHNQLFWMKTLSIKYCIQCILRKIVIILRLHYVFKTMFFKTFFFLKFIFNFPKIAMVAGYDDLKQVICSDFRKKITVSLCLRLFFLEKKLNLNLLSVAQKTVRNSGPHFDAKAVF